MRLTELCKVIWQESAMRLTELCKVIWQAHAVHLCGRGDGGHELVQGVLTGDVSGQESLGADHLDLDHPHVLDVVEGLEQTLCERGDREKRTVSETQAALQKQNPGYCTHSPLYMEEHQVYIRLIFL